MIDQNLLIAITLFLEHTNVLKLKQHLRQVHRLALASDPFKRYSPEYIDQCNRNHEEVMNFLDQIDEWEHLKSIEALERSIQPNY